MGNPFAKSSAVSFTALALGSFVWIPSTHASDLTTEGVVAYSAEPQWSVAIDPFYGWVPGFRGNARIFNNNVSLDIAAGDILGNLSSFIEILDGLYMGSGEARHENFGLQYDVVHLSVAGTNRFSIGSLVGGLDVGFGYSAATFAANYRINETASGYLDVIAGVRVSDLSTDLTLSLGPTVSASDGDTWADPVIGIKGRYLIDDNWFVKGSALYGGFGVSSHSLYDGAVFLGYQWSNGIEVYGGWRQAYTNYKNGTFKWDVTLSGPMLGFSIKW